MLDRGKHASRYRIRDEAGFTLIETLVSIVTGVVIIGAVFAILDVSLHQSARLSDTAQATQLGRTAMTKIVDELHSVCLSPGFAPVLTNSTNNELRFINAYSNEAVIPNATAAKLVGTGAYAHKIVWDESAKTLTDFSFKSTGGESPNYTFPSLEPENATPKGGVLLATNVTRTGSTPIFQYYRYSLVNSSTESTPEATLNTTPLTPPLSAETAKEAASVLVSFNASPSTKSTTANRSIDLSSQVTFAFTVPQSETTVTDAPCQ